MSFDDGHKEVFDIICPILKKRNIPATFFLITNTIDNRFLILPHKKSFILEKFISNSFSSEIIHKCETILGILDNDEKKNNIIKCFSKLSTKKKSDVDKIELISKALKINWQEVLEIYQPYLKTQNIQDMILDGFEIGSHGLNHIPFQSLNHLDWDHQVNKSLDFLKLNFQINKCSFSFPNSATSIDYDWMKKKINDNDLLEGFVGTSGFKNFEEFYFDRINIDQSNKKKILSIDKIITKSFLFKNKYSIFN